MATILRTICLLLLGSRSPAQTTPTYNQNVGNRTNYPIRVVPASTGTNFSIVKTAPEAGTNYTIRYVYP